MKFKMLLWYMARRMEILARTHPEFIAKLHGRDFVLQLQVEGGKTTRYFQVQHNRVLSRAAPHARPDLSITFKHGDYGFKVLTASDKNIFMHGVQEQKIKVEGDFSLLMWFMGVSKYLRPSRPRKSAAETASAA